MTASAQTRTRLGLIRHAPTLWNAERRLQGRTDMPLSPEGRASLAGLAPPPELAGARWFVSPLLRARETAEALGIESPTAEARLIEMSFGDWEGRTLAELRSDAPADTAAREARGRGLNPPNGETPEHVIARLSDFIRELSGAGGTIGAVTHLGVIRAALVLAHGWDMLGPAPEPVDWSAAHLFYIEPDGRLTPDRLNVPLAATGSP
ncbi:MAG: histidine phosphatase family protein [Alphaproteobacteria bacterium]|nr:histidine phosphatase family protein [Alphaproteobacteria bacterium]